MNVPYFVPGSRQSSDHDDACRLRTKYNELMIRMKPFLQTLLVGALMIALSGILHFSSFQDDYRDDLEEQSHQQPLHRNESLPESRLHQTGPKQNTIDKACFVHNSEAWLSGPRHGNIRDPRMTFDYVQALLLGMDSLLSKSTTTALSQSLCHEQSRFRSAKTEDMDLRQWTIRLIYLSTLYHQHRHAMPEAQARFSTTNSCSSALDTHDIGSFDFECPKAKYLITSFANIGLGANIRGGAVQALLAGLISDRVVLFVNNAPKGHKYLRSPWELTSCERRDYQCFFMPPSPCVLTHDDLSRAYSLTKGENGKLLNQGLLPKGHEDDKVWHMTIAFNPQRSIPAIAAERLRNYSLTLIDNLDHQDDNKLLDLLQRAANHIVDQEDRRPGYNYGAANLKVHHGLVIYSMRPSLTNAIKIDEILDEIHSADVNPELSVGLPIRASDKCIRESECLTFAQHMQAVSGVWSNLVTNLTKESANDGDPTVIFTTESQDMIQAQQDFFANATARSALPFAFRIVSNTRDVTPDTGFVSDATKNASFTADDALLSAVSSLKFQLLARVSVGNCCSNFHTMLADLLAGGCGAASDNTFHCLQENKDPVLRICCGWFKGCKEGRQQEIEQLLALNNKTLR